MIVQEGILPLNFEPELGDVYETAKSQVRGIITQKVRNPKGTVRVCIITSTLEIRWSTWTPS